MTEEILHAGKPRHSKKIIKTCARCNRKYHPRSNGYELISRYCSATCYERRKKPYDPKEEE